MSGIGRWCGFPTILDAMGTIEALWSLATVRTFLLDPVNGLDTNPGFSDGAGPYNPALLAKKTVAGLRDIMPVNFRGRAFRIIMAAGAYAQGLDALLNGAVGIGATSLVRGTATNATAGCTAFDDSAADRIYQGWTTCTGMNAAGYNPTGVPTTTVIQSVLAGGGAPAFPAERAYPLGARIRFDANTTTAALRNVCRMIGAVSGGDTLTMESALPAVPVAGDPNEKFYIEIGGLALPGFSLTTHTADNSTLSGGLQLCGIATSGSLNLLYGSNVLVGVFVGTAIGHFLQILGSANWSEQTSFTETTTGAAVQIGGCTRTSSSTSTGSGVVGAISAHVTLGDNTHGFSASSLENISVTGTIVVPTLTLTSNLNANLLAARVTGTGSTSAVGLSGRGSIGAISVNGAGAKPAIQLRAAQCFFVFSGIATGSTGNNDVGLDVTLCRNATIVLTATPTVTGALGDVRTGGGKIITWAQAAAGFTDQNGNTFIAANATRRVVGNFSGQLPVAVGAAFGYASDTGDGNLTNANPLRRPLSTRLINTLRASAPQGTAAAGPSLTATLYVNGAPSVPALSVVIAGGLAGAQKGVSTAVVFLAEGDDYDVRIDSGGATAAVLPFTATVEGP